MSDLFRIIGAVIFSIIMYAVPILATCSLTFHWGDEVQVPHIVHIFTESGELRNETVHIHDDRINHILI